MSATYDLPPEALLKEFEIAAKRLDAEIKTLKTELRSLESFKEATLKQIQELKARMEKVS